MYMLLFNYLIGQTSKIYICAPTLLYEYIVRVSDDLIWRGVEALLEIVNLSKVSILLPRVRRYKTIYIFLSTLSVNLIMDFKIG